MSSNMTKSATLTRLPESGIAIDELLLAISAFLRHGPAKKLTINGYCQNTLARRVGVDGHFDMIGSG